MKDLEKLSEKANHMSDLFYDITKNGFKLVQNHGKLAFLRKENDSSIWLPTEMVLSAE